MFLWACFGLVNVAQAEPAVKRNFRMAAMRWTHIEIATGCHLRAVVFCKLVNRNQLSFAIGCYSASL